MPALDPHNLDQLLAALESGDPAGLDERLLAQLEHALACNPELLARLADRTPAPPANLAVQLAAWEVVESPEPAAWNRMWDRIVAAEVRSGNTRGARRPLILRLWQPVMAAAACLLLTLGWRLGAPSESTTTDFWPILLATDADIQQVEVYDGDTSFIFATGGNNSVQVIWVLPQES